MNTDSQPVHMGNTAHMLPICANPHSFSDSFEENCANLFSDLSFKVICVEKFISKRRTICRSGEDSENMKEQPVIASEIDSRKKITDDYDCKKDCRNCPFPGAKCYPSKYDRYNTGLLIHKQ